MIYRILLLFLSTINLALASNEILYKIVKETHHQLEVIEIGKTFYKKDGVKKPLNEENYLNLQIEVEKFTLTNKSKEAKNCENAYIITIKNSEFKGCFKLQNDPFNLFYFNLHKYL